MKKIILTVLIIVLFIILLFKVCVKSDKNAITLMMWGRTEEIVAVDNFIKEFNKLYPEIRVKRMHVSSYYDKLQTMIAAGTPPDVMYMGSEYFPSYVSRDALLDLTPYLENDPEGKSPKFNPADFYPEVMAPFQYNGKYYGIAKDFSTMVLYYNKDLFDKEGVKYPPDSWTWQDFRKAAMALTRPGADKRIIDHYGFVFENWVGYWVSWVRQNGGEIYDDAAGRYIIGKEPYLSRNTEALQFIYDLMYNDHAAPTMQETQDMGTSQLFETGKVAMCTYGRWRTLELKNVRTFKWDVALLPYNKTRSSTLFTVCYSIAKRSKKIPEAWKLLKFLAGEAGQINTAESCLAIPSMKRIATSKHFFEPKILPFKVNANAFLDQIAYARPMPANAKAQEFNDLIGRHMDEIFQNKKPIREELILLQKEMDDLMK
ncbi:MAG: sugar ABC transporter substrate-binding protein [bacterium]|nr:sugar ABC transporter substrate-binding protein [bacterium]